jgi:hypothetical protein
MEGNVMWILPSEYKNYDVAFASGLGEKHYSALDHYIP